MQSPKQQNDNVTVAWTYPLFAAQKFIQLLEQIKYPTAEQRAMLATAYYTLVMQKNLSLHRKKLYVNTAITLLKSIPVSDREKHWNLKLAHAYFKRAEILEAKEQFNAASHDYHQVIEILKSAIKISKNDEALLLLAQASISIADLIVNEQVDTEKFMLFHPLFYINQALEHLSEIEEVDDNLWTVHAYAHQIAAIILSENYFEEAKEAFRVGLLMAFKSETVRISPLLVDIYTSLGALYERQYEKCPIQKTSESLLQHSMIYFGLSVLFNENNADENEEDVLVMESLFEIIYRLLDPFLLPLSLEVIHDLIDALVYTYICAIDKSLPNQALEQKLSEVDTLNTLVQHIFWLVMEAYRKQNPRKDIFEIFKPTEFRCEINREEILAVMKNSISDNIYYFKTKNEVLEDVFT